MEKEDKEKLVDKIQEVLDETFDNSEKRNILEYEDRINFACPYCGDSDNVRKKRANIYLSNLSFHCFNCDKHTDYMGFLHDFGVSAGSTIESAYNVIKTKKAERKNYVFDLGIFKKIDELAFTRSQIRSMFRLKEITIGKMYDYLNNRCLAKHLDRFMYNSFRNELYVLNLTQSGKICGFQIRSFDPDFVKYRTYNIAKIYKKKEIEFPITDEEAVNALNQTSMTYNITNTNLMGKVYVFEGGIDSFFLPNSIGICGVGRNFELVESLPNTRYFFDNDKAGFERTIQKAKDGKFVFLWKRFLGDYGFKQDLKDFNDLVVYLVRNRIKFDFADIDNYFSNDPFDLVYL